jgi:hypothetical protein
LHNIFSKFVTETRMKVPKTRNTLTNIMHDIKRLYHASRRVKFTPLKTIIIQAPGC